MSSKDVTSYQIQIISSRILHDNLEHPFILILFIHSFIHLFQKLCIDSVDEFNCNSLNFLVFFTLIFKFTKQIRKLVVLVCKVCLYNPPAYLKVYTSPKVYNRSR